MTKINEMMEKEFARPQATNMVQVGVNFEVSELFNDLATMYYQEAERVTRFTSNENVMVQTKEFDGYFRTLLFLRIARVNGVQNATTKSYKNDLRNYLVPAFVNVLLISIGKATDLNFGFEFYPTTSIDAKDLLSPTDMRNISQRLRILNMSGLVCVETGISMNPLGELEFMATMNIQGEILGYKKDHPIYGFYAAMFKHTIVSDVLVPKMLRVRYGAQDEYFHMLNHLFS